MTFTKDQLEVLSQWEENFKTAVNSGWARNPGRINLRTIYDIYSGALNNRSIPFNANCQHCIVNLLKAVGKIYFADKEQLQLEFEKENGRKVETKVELVGDDVVSKEIITEDALKKVSVKTEKRGKTRKKTVTVTEK